MKTKTVVNPGGKHGKGGGLHCRLLRWTAGGLLYGMVETFWRGHTHWSMILLAALLCIPLDIANERWIPWEMPLALQALLGGAIITAMEFLAGCILNLWLGWGIWDYSGLWGNLLGQICPQYALAWVPLAGLGILVFDWLDYQMGLAGRPRYHLWRWTEGSPR